MRTALKTPTMLRSECVFPRHLVIHFSINPAKTKGKSEGKKCKQVLEALSQQRQEQACSNEAEEKVCCVSVTPYSSQPLEVTVYQKSAAHRRPREPPRSHIKPNAAISHLCSVMSGFYSSWFKAAFERCRLRDWWDHRRKRLFPHLGVYLSCQLVSTKAARTLTVWVRGTAAGRRAAFSPQHLFHGWRFTEYGDVLQLCP